MVASSAESELVSNVGDRYRSTIGGGVCVAATLDQNVSGVVRISLDLCVIDEGLSVSGLVLEVEGLVRTADFGLGQNGDVLVGLLFLEVLGELLLLEGLLGLTEGGLTLGQGAGNADDDAEDVN